ncbi:unnamed protein product [Schistosoma turkestanicum]|nr:unnamed protein product [Schistosoma turkestanicum]
MKITIFTALLLIVVVCCNDVFGTPTMNRRRFQNQVRADNGDEEPWETFDENAGVEEYVRYYRRGDK